MMSYGDRFTTDGPTYSLNTKFSPTDLDKSLESHLSPFQPFFPFFFHRFLSTSPSSLLTFLRLHLLDGRNWSERKGGKK